LKRIGIALFSTRLAVRSKCGRVLRLASLGAPRPQLSATIKAIFQRSILSASGGSAFCPLGPFCPLKDLKDLNDINAVVLEQ
jgi:hypothetical protein